MPTQYGWLHGSRMILKRYLVHVKAVTKIIECLSATAHLSLTFGKDIKLEDTQLEYDLETYVDADYAHEADDGRSISGVAVCCEGTLVSWLSTTQKCVTLSIYRDGVRSNGRRGEGSPLRERSAGFSGAQSGVAEYWSV